MSFKTLEKLSSRSSSGMKDVARSSVLEFDDKDDRRGHEGYAHDRGEPDVNRISIGAGV